MKLTTARLKKLIREELNKLNEAGMQATMVGADSYNQSRKSSENKIRNQQLFVKRLLNLEEILRRIGSQNLKEHHEMIQKYLKAIKQDDSYKSNKTAKEIGIYDSIEFSDKTSGHNYGNSSVEDLIINLRNIALFIMDKDNFYGNDRRSDLKANGEPFDVTDFRKLNQIANSLDFAKMSQQAAAKNPNPTLIPDGSSQARKRTFGFGK